MFGTYVETQLQENSTYLIPSTYSIPSLKKNYLLLVQNLLFLSFMEFSLDLIIMVFICCKGKATILKFPAVFF